MNGQAMPIVEVVVIPEVYEVEISVTSTNDQPIKLATFEKRRWLYYLTMPISWLLTIYVMAKKAVYKLCRISGPNINTFWFDGLGVSTQKVKETAASWKALDEIYNYHFRFSLTPKVFIDNFWEGMLNCQAVRNRYKLVKQEIRRAILRFSNHQEVRLVSLACGSAQAVIEVMAEFKAKGVPVRTILVDINQDALDYANKLAKQNGVAGQITTMKTSVSQIVRIARDFKPQVIEMLGLLDYIPQDKAIRLVGKIYESLETKGIFLTCNIAPNPEMHFVTWVINWQMIYRKPIHLTEIVYKAGFSDFRLIYEPLKVHGLVVAQKA